MAAPKKRTDEEIQDAVLRNPTIVAASKELSMNERTVRRRLTDLRKRGFAPESNWKDVVPEGFLVKGKSELKRGNETVLTWVKSSIDKDYFLEALDVIKESFALELPKAKPVTLPFKIFNTDLLSCYILTDAHVGMYAFGQETRGGDWNLQKAEEVICDWFREVISMSPPSETAILANLGDYFHYAGLVAETPQHRNPLDASGRFGEMVDVGLRILRRIIDMLLKKHKHVRVLLVSGNHDDPVMTVLRHSMPASYDSETRISFEKSDNNFCEFKFHKVGLFFTHGDKAHKNLDQVAVSHFPKTYGDTEYRYLHHGHKHHAHRKDDILMTTEGHPTLSAPDAYAALNGYKAQRYASCIVYHKDFGDYMRINPPVAIVE